MDTAFFVLSRIFRVFSDPGNVLLALLLAATAMVWLKWMKPARWLLGLASGLALLAILVPVGGYTGTFLENRFPGNPPLPDRVDGIVVLGGVVSARVTLGRGDTSISGAVERLMAFADLSKLYPDAALVFTGGSGHLMYQEFKEADFVAPILQKLGMNTKNMIFEAQSRNTYENAVYSFDLVKPEPDETWILVTSAAHMPRAMGVFRATGWPNVIPYPVDFNTIGEISHSPPLNLIDGLNGFRRALYEAAGLAAYYLTGKTGALIPAP